MNVRRLMRRAARSWAGIEPHLVVGLSVVAAFVAGLVFALAPMACAFGVIVLVAIALLVVEELAR